MSKAWNTARIERLRAAAVNPYICYDEFYLHFYRDMAVSQGAFEFRMAHAWAHAFENIRPVIGEDDRL